VIWKKTCQDTHSYSLCSINMESRTARSGRDASWSCCTIWDSLATFYDLGAWFDQPFEDGAIRQLTKRNTEWERLLLSFQSVLAVRRLLSPLSITSLTALRLVTTSSRKGVMITLKPVPCNATGTRDAPTPEANRSWICSLYISR
jgi:hypothetical protein